MVNAMALFFILVFVPFFLIIIIIIIVIITTMLLLLLSSSSLLFCFQIFFQHIIYDYTCVHKFFWTSLIHCVSNFQMIFFLSKFILLFIIQPALVINNHPCFPRPSHSHSSSTTCLCITFMPNSQMLHCHHQLLS